MTNTRNLKYTHVYNFNTEWNIVIKHNEIEEWCLLGCYAIWLL
jgi:hypothetical protein